MSENEVKNINNEDLSSLAAFWNKIGKKLATAAAIVLVVVGAWFGYQEFIIKP